MDIDLTKVQTDQPDDRSDSACLSSNGLRQRIRDLISEFIAKSRPVRPSDGDIMNEYLKFVVPEFGAINERIFALEEDWRNAKAPEKKKIQRQIESSKAKRLEIITETACTSEFLKFRSEKYRLFNEALARYDDEAFTINKLKEYLGMPHLPSMVAKTFSAASILTFLQAETQKAPIKGQMVLQLDENVYNRRQFLPRSAFHTGIAPEVLGRSSSSLIRVPFDPESTLGVEALSLGAFERSGKVYFKVEDRKPVAQAHWNEIDRYLPYACRSISVPLLPMISSLPSGFDFSEVFGKDAWAMIEAEVLEKHGDACLICGSDKDVKVTARWRFREPITGTYGPGVQQLEGYVPMCSSCMDTFRPSVQSLLRKSPEGHVLKISQERQAWIRTINRWEDPKEKVFAADAYMIAIEAYRRRSRINWIVDLSVQRSVFLCLTEGHYVDGEDWIWPIVGAPFKIVGTPFYEHRDCNRNYVKKPGIFDVPWGSTIEQVQERIRQAGSSDLAVADTQGQGYVVDFPKNPVPDLSPELKEKISAVNSHHVESLEIDSSNRPASDVEIGIDMLSMETQKSLEVNIAGSSSSNALERSKAIDDDDDDDDEVVTTKIDYN